MEMRKKIWRIIIEVVFLVIVTIIGAVIIGGIVGYLIFIIKVPQPYYHLVFVGGITLGSCLFAVYGFWVGHKICDILEE